MNGLLETHNFKGNHSVFTKTFYSQSAISAVKLLTS